jgi:hypothetical protein
MDKIAKALNVGESTIQRGTGYLATTQATVERRVCLGRIWSRVVLAPCRTLIRFRQGRAPSAYPLRAPSNKYYRDKN